MTIHAGNSTAQSLTTRGSRSDGDREMAFHHFHKHSKKYLILATIAMVFSLLTFSITSALTGFAESGGARNDEAYFRFKTSSGKQVQMTTEQWFLFSRRATALRNIAFQLQRTGSPLMLLVADVQDMDTAQNLPVVQAVLCAEADEMGIVIPDEMVEEWWQIFLDSLQPLMQNGLTKGQLNSLLARQQVDAGSFRQALREGLQSYVYRQTIRGAPIHQPQDLLRHFIHRNELITMDFVEFPVEQYRAELQAKLPSDEELEEYYANMDSVVLRRDFSTVETLSLELALVNHETFDPDAVPAEMLAAFTEPTDDQLMDRYRRDPTRYRRTETPVETAAELDDETRSRIIKDLKIREVMLHLRRQYESFVAEQAAAEASDDDAANEEGSEETESAAEPTQEEKLEAQSAEFRRLAEAIGLEFQLVEDVTRAELAELDPPKDSSMQFIVGGLREPGAIQSVDAAGERTYGYLIRLVAKTPAATKPFAEARDEVLEQWLDETAAERAKAAAQNFRDAIRDAALADVEASKLANVEQEYQEALSSLEENTELSEYQRETGEKNAEKERFLNLACLAFGKEDELFESKANEMGLEIRAFEPFRRNEGLTAHFSQTAEGAEKFLKRQDSRYSREPMLLGYASETVSDVLVDTESNSAYVARIVDRAEPTFEMMSPYDRQEAVTANEREILTQQPRIPYLNPFSFNRIVSGHQPEIRVFDTADEDSEEGDSGTGS